MSTYFYVIIRLLIYLCKCTCGWRARTLLVLCLYWCTFGWLFWLFASFKFRFVGAQSEFQIPFLPCFVKKKFLINCVIRSLVHTFCVYWMPLSGLWLYISLSLGSFIMPIWLQLFLHYHFAYFEFRFSAVSGKLNSANSEAVLSNETHRKQKMVNALKEAIYEKVEVLAGTDTAESLDTHLETMSMSSNATPY